MTKTKLSVEEKTVGTAENTVSHTGRDRERKSKMK